MAKRASTHIISRLIILIAILFMQNICFADDKTDYRGTLLSTDDNAVFYISKDNKKYNFLDKETYSSWFDKFDYVKIVPKSTIDSYELGGMIRYKPGKYENFKNKLQTGSIVKNIGTNEYYYIEGEYKRPFLNEVAFLDNGFNFENSIEIDLSDYKTGTFIDKYENSLRRDSKFSMPLIRDYDSDKDGLSDYDEAYFYYTNYNDKDTDGDKITDGDEIKNNLSPLHKNKKLIEIDTDGDGLNDFFEIAMKTDLKNTDSDEDSYSDGDEFKNNYDPTKNDTNKKEKLIKVDLKKQLLEYYLGDKLIDSFLISSGIAGMRTPTGDFKILNKVPTKQYGGTGYNYYYPNTKWNLHFTTGKYRYYIHGAYWHNNFGRPMSHGCVNVSYIDMEPLYSFADIGTKIIIK